jgi:electron transfer flavoprotein beta subunit
MNLLVCMKRVPDTASKIKIGADGRSIDEAGIQWVLNPYDEFAVEEALRLKEKAGKGEVTVLTVGPADAAQTLRSALAMGADKGIHVKDEAKNRDPAAVAGAIVAAVKGLAAKPDLILFGRQAVDDQSLAVGPMVATMLDLPCVTDIVKLEVSKVESAGTTATVHREIEGGHEVVELDLPAVLTTNKGLNEPRYASLKGIMAAKKKPIETRDAAGTVPEDRAFVRAMEYPPERKGGRVVGQGADAVPELVRLLREEAKAL